MDMMDTMDMIAPCPAASPNPAPFCRSPIVSIMSIVSTTSPQPLGQSDGKRSAHAATIAQTIAQSPTPGQAEKKRILTT